MIGIAAFLFVLAAPFFVYKNAKQNGHNAVLWTIISIVAGLGVQIILPFVIIVLIGIIWTITGSNQTETQEAMQSISFPMGFIALFISIIGVLAVMKKVNTIPDEAFLTVQPPPPPTFE
jgi:hypothetical protein